MQQAKQRSFRGLLVWRQAMDLARETYLLTRTFPKEELYGLTSQIRRAAVSVPANIAEGTGRATRRDFVNFLRIAQGSLREIETYLLLTVEIKLATPSSTAPLLAQAESVAKLLNRLIHSLEITQQRTT
jgi:four helix bundle protein